jgi:hypothetical protein
MLMGRRDQNPGEIVMDGGATQRQSPSLPMKVSAGEKDSWSEADRRGGRVMGRGSPIIAHTHGIE